MLAIFFGLILGLMGIGLTPTAGYAGEGVFPSIAVAETLRFAPIDDDSTELDEREKPDAAVDERWLRAPFGDRLLTDIEQWRAENGSGYQVEPLLDYNRVDRLFLGLAAQYALPLDVAPRIGARIGYALGRKRTIYGVQVEQPLGASGVTVGATAVRLTDHYDLQQTGDAENSLALLFARQDYRDYFEREGVEGYVAWRIPRASTLSAHLRGDQYGSLSLDRGTRSWFQRYRSLRDNPPVDAGDTRAVTVRLERLALRTALTRAGFYHWVELERAGGGLGGDFDYSRLLLDLRGSIRVSPATTLALRTVGGTTMSGRLPVQRQFTLGGVDGLRAHRLLEFRGNQTALVQAEYTIGLWRMASGLFEGGLHAIVFVDAGRAWVAPAGRWDIANRSMAVDGGFGLSTSEDNLRVYFARDLQESDSDFLVTVRLQRPF